MMRDLAQLWSKDGSDFLREKATTIQAAADDTQPGPYRRTMEASANAWRRAWIAFEDAWREVLRPVELPRPIEDVTAHYGSTLVNVKTWDGVPESAQRDLKAAAHELGARLQDYGLDIHVEAYPLREDTRKILEKT